MVHGKKVPQVCRMDEINFCYDNIDVINANAGHSPTGQPQLGDRARQAYLRPILNDVKPQAA